jgi:hypothetical protein
VCSIVCCFDSWLNPQSWLCWYRIDGRSMVYEEVEEEGKVRSRRSGMSVSRARSHPHANEDFVSSSSASSVCSHYTVCQITPRSKVTVTPPAGRLTRTWRSRTAGVTVPKMWSTHCMTNSRLAQHTILAINQLKEITPRFLPLNNRASFDLVWGMFAKGHSG